MALQEDSDRIGVLEDAVSHVLRFAVVTKVLEDKGMVRVELKDADELVSYEIPVLQPKTLKDKFYWMPDKGEHGAVLFAGNGVEQGVWLGAIFSEQDKPPVKSKDKLHIMFEDETFIEYDREESKLSGECKGDVELKVEGDVKLEIEGDVELKIKGDNTVTIKGDASLKVEGDCNVDIQGQGKVACKDVLQLQGKIVEVNS